MKTSEQLYGQPTSGEELQPSNEVALNSPEELSRELNRLVDEEGYNVVTSASGPWVNGARVIHENAFRHPEGKIVRLTTYKQEDQGGFSVKSSPHMSGELTAEEYDEHIRQWQLTVGPERTIN